MVLGAESFGLECHISPYMWSLIVILAHMCGVGRGQLWTGYLESHIRFIYFIFQVYDHMCGLHSEVDNT